jgi:predicted nucleotide-binding protein (sugar kinase/HSP70/actin superfamily)
MATSQQLVNISTSPKPANHYKAYKPKPFLREERDKVTILFGGLTWKHERLIQGTLHNLNYKAEPLPNIKRDDLDAGKELIDVGACCPTIFTTGSLVNLLKDKVAAEGKEKTIDNYIFLTAGACGPCRFGQYHESYSMALDGLGLRDFRMFLMAQDNLDQDDSEGGGLQVNLPFTLGTIWSLLVADVLMDLEYMTRPYEVVPGSTDKVLQESIEYLYGVFRNRPMQSSKLGTFAFHVTGTYFTKALRHVRKMWDAIEVDHTRVKAKVKITGEFWLQTHEGEGNYNIKRWLESEDSEVVPPPVAVWLDYLVHPMIRKLENRHSVSKHPKLENFALAGAEKAFRNLYNRFRHALNDLPNELPDQEELRELAAPFYHFELRGGEGHMLIGKALYAYHHKKAHMTCELSPYSCMPNTMSIGSMANVLGKYPDLLYAPIEIKGDSEVHALSRCQMILTEAKKRAKSEFDEALAKSGLTLDDIRAYEAQHPELRSATYKVPHHGCSGTAANYVLHLALDKGLKAKTAPAAVAAHA